MVNLLLLYGLALCGSVQCSWARVHSQLVANSDLIVAPDPEDNVVNTDGDVPILESAGINLCENMADSLLPYVGNCSNYVICEGGNLTSYGSCYEEEPVEKLCNGNTTDCKILFDYKFQACVSATDNDVKCLPECEAFNLTSFCYDRTCTKYVLCYYGIPVLRECYDGLQYNAETDRCDFPEYVDCVENDCPQYMSISSIRYLPSKAQCSKYFICSDGMAWPQECASGLFFNPKCNCCDYASNVECKETPQQRNIKPYSRSPPRRADVVCPSQGIHFYAHKSRRDAYYYCVEGRGVTLDCTPGLLYDSKKHECRQPKYIGI
ncbi:probable chitinase 10 [Drosophila novamexicana]|uniref:probable chitinase 10 n=1 Tax=Drosophila novamexicana TaxID=47314 RepID=UPI0011E5F04E|nr:probable chitinase 10 [Drosophila novamexicana]